MVRINALTAARVQWEVHQGVSHAHAYQDIPEPPAKQVNMNPPSEIQVQNDMELIIYYLAFDTTLVIISGILFLLLILGYYFSLQM